MPCPNRPQHRRLSEWIETACLLEATARKPGNVHPQASFADLQYRDFVISARTVAPILAATRELGVGRAVLEAVAATQAAVGRNTNLGIVLSLAPLCAVPPEVPLADGIGDVLDRLTQEDARLVYHAVRTARPGGMGTVAKEDLSQEPKGTLREVMRLAAGRDLVAAQYAGRFETVLDFGLPLLQRSLVFENANDPTPAVDWLISNPLSDDWEQAVVGLQLELMARHPDTLIARKCGIAEARKSARRAQQVLDAGWPAQRGQEELRRFDHWLRAEANRRNPGTTADLITACLFAALRERGRLLYAPSP